MWMEIILINKQESFTKIDKDIRFCGLVPIDKRTKEEWYRALGVVMIHYKNKGFLLNTLNVMVSLNKL